MAVATSLHSLCIGSGVVMTTTAQSHSVDAEVKGSCAQCRGHLAAGTGGRNAWMEAWYGVEGRRNKVPMYGEVRGTHSSDPCFPGLVQTAKAMPYTTVELS
jgi:hypothetical protein